MMLIGCCPFMSRKNSYDQIDDDYSRSSERPDTEASSLLKSGDATLVDAYLASYRSWEDDVNLWSDPYDVTHTRSSHDGELDGLIRAWRKSKTEMEWGLWKAKQAKVQNLGVNIDMNAKSRWFYQGGTSLDLYKRERMHVYNHGEKKSIYQRIQTIRSQRKRVQERWKTVLKELGFTSEVERLVSISSASTTSIPPPPSDQAIDMHATLVRVTEIFGDGEVQDRRYSIILDRLISLDVADDFITKAKELFPKEPDGIAPSLSRP